MKRTSSDSHFTFTGGVRPVARRRPAANADECKIFYTGRAEFRMAAAKGIVGERRRLSRVMAPVRRPEPRSVAYHWPIPPVFRNRGESSAHRGVMME